MPFRILTALILCFSLFASPSSPQDKKISFDGKAAFEYVKALSADGMEGRKSGERGGQWAADLIAARLKEWGLEPAGPKGGYFQDFTYEYYNVERGALLDIVAHSAKRDFVYGEDWRQAAFSGSGAIGADIVFAGYGISAPDKGFDEYAGADVKGKVVLFAVETPRRYETVLGEAATLAGRIRAAQARGARGVMMFRSDTQAAGGFPRGGLTKDMYKPDFVSISVEPKIVNFIFKWHHADPRYFFQQIEATGKPQTHDLGVRTFVNLQTVFDEKRPTQNVLAKIPGTDPALKNEYVVIGAHMDHLGIDQAGDVLNGADDNASGTAVVMETARVMKLNGFKPKRAIVFALWGAEEEGLLGSKYYTENPVYPIEKTVANINLDMEGHGTGRVNVGGAYFAPEVWEILKAGLPKPILEKAVPSRGGPGGSDHTHFLHNGVPAFMVNTEGPHFKTNAVGDVIDLIKPEILKASGDFVMAAAEVLATDPKIPIVPKRKETFLWRNQTVVDYSTPGLADVIRERKDVLNPDVDFQLAVLAEKAGLAGDALRIDLLNSLLSGKDEIARTAGLTFFGAAAPAAGGMMGLRGGPGKTTVLAGLAGPAAVRDDLRWLEVYSKMGIGFLSLDKPDFLFRDGALSDEGKKLVEAAGRANLLLIVKGLDPARMKALLEAAKKPLFLETGAVLGEEILGLVKKTESTVGLVLGKDEDPAAYVKKIDEAKKTVGTEYLAIVSDRALNQSEGRDRMIGVISELFKAKYALEDLTNLFSAAFMRALNRAVRP